MCPPPPNFEFVLCKKSEYVMNFHHVAKKFTLSFNFHKIDFLVVICKSFLGYHQENDFIIFL